MLLSEIADVMLAIESELRRLELWSDERPSVEALSSPQPFCYDTLQFTQWVQWVFLPRMKQIIEQGGPLPAQSAIKPMVEEMMKDVDAANFIGLFDRFDQLITKGSQ